MPAKHGYHGTPRSRQITTPVVITVIILMAVSCGIRSLPAIPEVSIDGPAAAQTALENYDLDRDGQIAGEELRTAASLQSGLAELDSDGDRKVSAAEIAAIVNRWEESGVGLVSIYCLVTLDGRPLQGATITFEPEEFLGETVATAVGTSDSDGTVQLVVAGKDSEGLPGGVQPGFYKVRISKSRSGAEELPAKYNSATQLGQMVSTSGRQPAIQFDLRR